MIKEYLEDRVRIVEKEIVDLQEKKRMCQISVKQINAQIFEVENESDETSKLLSVSVRDNLAAKDQEVKDMKNHISQYFKEIDEYKQQIKNKENELELINLCLKEEEDLNVSRETLDEVARVKNVSTVKEQSKSEKPGGSLDISSKTFDEDKYAENKKIKDKLEFCQKLCRVDGNRVAIELEKLIKEL